MDLRRPIRFFVFGMVGLVVTFAVLAGASRFSSATGDAPGAIILWRIAAGCLVLLVIDLLLLVGLLGIVAMDEDNIPHSQADKEADSSQGAGGE